MTGKTSRRRMRAGYLVFSALAGIKLIEYVVTRSITAGNWPFLAVLAVVSAVLIVVYYKHIAQLWRPGGEESG